MVIWRVKRNQRSNLIWTHYYSVLKGLDKYKLKLNVENLSIQDV